MFPRIWISWTTDGMPDMLRNPYMQITYIKNLKMCYNILHVSHSYLQNTKNSNFELGIFAISWYIYESKFSEVSKQQATGFSTPIYKPGLKFRSRKILKPSLTGGSRTDKSRNIDITEKLEDGTIGYGRDSSVSTATPYGLDGPGIEF